MIDLHCHIIDGTGCGPSDFAGSLALCRRAIEDGVTTAVATPRWGGESTEPPLHPDAFEERLERLRGELGGALDLRAGYLLSYGPRLPQLVERHGARLALNGGRYLLVSLPPLAPPPCTTDALRALRGQGFSVMLSRPECSPALRLEPSVLDSWLGEGALLQLDAASVAGAHGREIQAFALRYAERCAGRAVVASSARGAGSRARGMGAASEALTKALGARAAYELLSGTPAEILNTGAEQSRPRTRRPGDGLSGPLRRTIRAVGSLSGWLT